MTFSRRGALGAAFASVAVSPSRASTWAPTRPVRLVVSSAPAASLDTLARIIAPALSARLGQSVLVENQGGANGLIAMQQVSRGEADGHTLLVTGDAIVLAELIAPNPGFTVRGSFTPVTQAVRAAQILATHPASGFTDIAGYVAAVKKRPGRLNVGLPAWGGIAHVVHELLSQAAGGLPVEYVTYRGGGPAATDLLARHLDALVITLPAITEQVRQGAIVPLAVTTAARDAALPDVPTLAETIAPGYDVESWQGLLVPKGVPAPVVAALHGAIAATLRDPAVQDRLTGLGFEVVADGPEDFARRTDESTQRFAGVVRAAGMRQAGG
ncbi:tripartite tricarboxylate transporter substrate binding protein [Roseomonas sp. CAU 1739]|uniref:Bug family tripartite tricarboxylate transporter substrate binding protein n=1 Tax=Roseomonas sp. CAU 1739 TaxID=3140364 RepID=UPI00325B6C0D